MSSNSGELDSSMSLSNSLALSHLQLKRTYCYAIVNAKAKMITFYCFTTENCNYDSIKLLLDQAADLINQRYHLLNNTVLYKFGGLIGDSILYDLKKVKAVSTAACLQNSPGHQATNSDENTEDTNKITTPTAKTLGGVNVGGANPNASIMSQILSKSPIIIRQLSYKSVVNPINPSLVSNLQFLNTEKAASGWSKDPTPAAINMSNPGLAPLGYSSSGGQHSANQNWVIIFSNAN